MEINEKVVFEIILESFGESAVYYFSKFKELSQSEKEQILAEIKKSYEANLEYGEKPEDALRDAVALVIESLAVQEEDSHKRKK